MRCTVDEVMSTRAGSTPPAADRDGVASVLGSVTDPETGVGLGELGMIRRLAVRDGSVAVTVSLAPAQQRSGDRISDAVAAALADVPGVERVEVRLVTMSEAEQQRAMAALRARQGEDPPYFADGQTKVVLVSSGKGGVGKSTVAVNLACSLAAAGKRVGLLDADVWGYSVPGMMGSGGDPVGIGELLLPERVHGVKAVSIGFLTEERSPVVWRGPMLHEAIHQFISGVSWGELDLLIVDLPPGTGDVPISLASLVPGVNVVVVTTPQEAAWRVAELAGLMAERAKLRLVGVVENMAGFVCPHCGEASEPFGGSGGEELAGGLGVPLLGRVPMSARLRRGGDEGAPIVLSEPDDPAAAAIGAVAVEIDRRSRAVKSEQTSIALPMLPARDGPGCAAHGGTPGTAAGAISVITSTGTGG
jgi:ATP-binding protein involved in chromosome partitioning